jgi:hypothetical protein
MSARKRPIPLPSVPPQRAAAAYEAILARAEALPASAVRAINVDVPRAVALVLDALPAIRALRPDIGRELPSYPAASLDDLETYALGAWYAHLLALPETGDLPAVTLLIEEGVALREGLLVAADKLVARGVLDPVMVAQIRSGQGTLKLANDLVALSALVTMHTQAVKGTAATAAVAARAASLGPELLSAFGRPGAAAAKKRAERRARAFTLMADAYDDCRRAVAYLRWNEKDADEIAPSIFDTRSARRRKAGSGRSIEAALRSNPKKRNGGEGRSTDREPIELRRRNKDCA